MSEHPPVVTEPSAVPTPKSLPLRYAQLIMLASLVIGILGDLLFYDKGVGINLTLFATFFFVGGMALLGMAERNIYLKNAFFIAPALIFAFMVSYINNEGLTSFNLMIMAVTLFVAIRFANNPAFLGGHWRIPILAGFETLLVGWLDAVTLVITDSLRWVTRLDLNAENQKTMQSVARGFLITAPVLLVFGALLGSADAVLGNLLEAGLGWLIPDNITSLMGHIILIGFLTWFATIIYHPLLLDRKNIFQIPPLENIVTLRTKGLGMIETTMLIGSIDALFLLFVILQGTYLFGGEKNITSAGYTFSEYARRGFFEIVVVSVMTILLTLSVRLFTQPNTLQNKRFKYLIAFMLGLTMILLVAAFKRLDLYIDAYGYTQLRVITQVFIVWMALALLVLAVDIVREKHWFYVAAFGIGMAYILTLNVMNLDAFIANRNIERFERTGKIDVEYLSQLSDDALPATAALLESKKLKPEDREFLLDYLGYRLYQLDQYQDDQHWLGTHFGKERAWDALDAHRKILAPYYDAQYGVNSERF